MQQANIYKRIENGRTDLTCELLAATDEPGTLREHGANLLTWCAYHGHWRLRE